MASGHNSSNEVRASDTSITSPEYSSVTARNVRQEFRKNRPGQPESQDNTRPGEDVVELLREEFSRQMRDFQMSIRQDLARAVGQQQPQASVPITANGNMASNIQPPMATTRQPAWSSNHLSTHLLQGNAVPLQPANIHPPRTTAQAYDQPPRHSHSYPQAFGSGSSLAPDNFHMDFSQSSHNRVDLSKWGIKFDGTSKSMSAEDFIFRIDILRQDYGYSFNDILRSFHLLLEGHALDWYWNVRKLTPIRNWQDLEAAFLMQYRRYENEFQIQKKIMDRRQAPQESFEDFYNDIIKLRNQQRTPYAERDLIEIMKSNLKPALSHLLFSVRIEGLNDFCQQAKRAESLLANQRQQHMQRTYVAHRVNELDHRDDNAIDTNFEVEALAASSRYTCWNCKQLGHSFVDCPSSTRRIFCFRCGKEGVVTPKCPRCQGNSGLNKPHTGETRSTQT